MSEGAPPDHHPRFRGFDGLRAVAILLVLLWHTFVVTSFPAAALGPLRPLVLTGWAGVDLFFALSGFLITSLLLREEQGRLDQGRPQGFSLGRFYGRRALRILPVFYVVFALNSYLLSWMPVFRSIRAQEVWRGDSPLGLVPYATFMGTYFLTYGHKWFPAPPIVLPGEAYDVFWSLCVEEHFYLLWPAFLLLVRSLRARVAVAVAICVSLPALRAAAIGLGWDEQFAVHFASHYRLDSILWGGLAALVLPHLTLTVRQRRLLLLGIAGLVALLAVTRTLSVMPPVSALGEGPGLSLLALGTALLLIDLVREPESLLGRVLEWRPLALVGQLSYAIYLVHLPMMDLGSHILFGVPRAATLGNLALACVLFTALSVAAAWVLHVVVERPALTLKDRWFG